MSSLSPSYIPARVILGREKAKSGENCFGHSIMGTLLLFRHQEIGSITEITSLPTFVRNKWKIILISSINAYDAKILDGFNPGYQNSSAFWSLIFFIFKHWYPLQVYKSAILPVLFLTPMVLPTSTTTNPHTYY